MARPDLGAPAWQGAEARVYVSAVGGRDAVVKERFAKDYRHAELDVRLRRARTSLEARCLVRAAGAGVRVPALLEPFRKGDTVLVMERIEGGTLKAHLASDPNWEPIADEVAAMVARLHASAGIVHGDLTTSNVLVSPAGLVLIDFGMAEVSASAEDRAVDLYVLERALLSTHPAIGRAFFARFLSAYAANAGPSAQATLTRLAAVQLRGRKRDMAG